jgi:hypothetical protein
MRRPTRAVLLAITVAVSAVVLPVGTLAAAPPQPAAIGDDGTVAQVGGADATLGSGGSFWQGWELGVDASRVIEGGDRDLEVWVVTEDGQLSQRAATVTADDAGVVVVRTRRLNGRYVLRYDGQPVYVQGGEAYLDAPPDGSEVTVETSAFRVERQTFTFEWADPEVFPGQDTALTASSNRERSLVAVSAEGLSFEDLTTVFPESAYAPDHDARADDDQLHLVIQANRTLRVNTSLLEPGSRPFDVNVVDTTARARPSLTVKQPASGRRILAVEQREHVGDVLAVELACSSCHLVVGLPEQGTVDIVELRDTNGDGRVTVHMNTRYAGLNTGASGYPSNQRQYTSPTDSVNRYEPETTLEEIERELSYAVNTAGKLRDRLGLEATGRFRPIPPRRLLLTVASSDFLIPRSAWGDKAPYGSEMVIRDETDARTVELVPRSLDGAQSMAAPGDGFQPTAASLRSSAASRTLVALGDRLVFRIDASGLFGYLRAHGASVETLQRNDDEGFDLALHRLADGSAKRLLLQQVGVRFVPDPTHDALYVVFGTGDARLNYLDAGEYRLTLTVEGVAARHEAYSTRNAFDGYPYLEPGGLVTASATVTLDPAAGAITDPTAGTSPRLTSDGTLRVEGTATVAAGTMLRVRAAATEFAWETSDSVNVSTLGSWETALDLSDAPGQEFSVTLSQGDRVLAEETFTVRPPATDGSTDGTPGDEATVDGQGSTGGSGAESTGTVAGEDGSTQGGDGGSFIPGISNIALYGGIFFLVMVLLLVGRAVM